MHGFPFAFAHIKAVVAAGPTPVDPVGSLALHEGTELPKCFAGTRFVASMHAALYGLGYTACFHGQTRQLTGERVGGLCGLVAAGVQDRLCHDGQDRRSVKRLISMSSVTLSARAL